MHSINRPFLSIIAIVVWFALATQLYLTLQTSGVAKAEIMIRYISYFTILTNMMIAGYSTTLLLFPHSKLARFFNRQSTAAAIVVYIAVVGLIYNAILRFTWEPKGLQRVVDESLHLIVPLLFIGYWHFVVGKDQLKWKDIWWWLAYPLVYIIYTLLRGIPSGFYPYPFVDVAKLGYEKVFINSLGVTAVFCVLSLAVVGIGKRFK